MTSLLVVTVLAHVALLLEIAAYNQTLSPVIGDKRWKNQHANAKCRMTWGLKCDLICRQCCHGRFSSKLLTFQNKSIFYSAKSSQMIENCWITLREQIDCDRIISLWATSRHFARLLQIYTRCFPSAPCKQPWHIHPFYRYCARAQLLHETAAGHCLYSRLSSVSKWSGKQTAFKAHRNCVWRVWGRTRWLSDSSLSLPALFLRTQYPRDGVTEDSVKDGPMVVRKQSFLNN